MSSTMGMAGSIPAHPSSGFVSGANVDSSSPGGRCDAELMQALADGDSDAMAVLFAQYHKLVRSTALKIVHDRAEADDVVQTVFFDLFRAADQFDSRKGTIKVWLLQYAYHRALHRKRHLVASRFYEWDDIELASRSLAERDSVSPEWILLVDQLIGSLDSSQRTAVRLAYFEGFTAEEISTLLRQSVHVVRHDLRRALNIMRKIVRTSVSEGSPSWQELRPLRSRRAH